MSQFVPETKPGSRSSTGRTTTSYSTFLPFLIVLLTLIGSTTREIVILYQRKIAIVVQNGRAAEPLKIASEQSAFVDSLRTDLVKLAPTDPVAARIITEFFTAPAAVKKADPTDTSTSPPQKPDSSAPASTNNP